MNKHKLFIKEAYEGKHGSICQEWKDTILKQYPEFKEEEFKVGDWVMGWHHLHSKRVVSPWRIKRITSGGYFVPNDEYGNCHPKHLRKATKEEIEQHLIKEAERRGFGNGSSAKCLVSNGCHYTIKDNDWDYRVKTDTLFNGICMVYREGKWSEMINTMTKEEAERKLNCKIV